VVLEFYDPGAPAIHVVEGKMGDPARAWWARLLADISSTGEADVYEARLEMPEAKCASFRVRRLDSAEVPDLRILSVRTRPAEGLICGIDVAYANSVTNEEPSGEPRVEGPDDPIVQGREEYYPGIVGVLFRQDTSEEEAVALFRGLGLAFEPCFPKRFGLSCRVTSGDVSEHIRGLEESGLVLWARRAHRSGDDGVWISMMFRVGVTVEMAEELFASIDGVEPDWGSYLEAPKFGEVLVPEGHEFAWCLAMEHHPIITHAEVSVIGHIAI
jgi:hypothetical protein